MLLVLAHTNRRMTLVSPTASHPFRLSSRRLSPPYLRCSSQCIITSPASCILRGFLPPTDWTIFPAIDAADVRSLLPGNTPTLSLIHHLCLRLIEDARLLYGDTKGDFHIYPPTNPPCPRMGSLLRPSTSHLSGATFLGHPLYFSPFLWRGTGS